MRPHTLTIFIFLGLSSLTTFCTGQNLVANGSFEEYTECPDLGTQIDRATGWSAYRGSPDYFNACDVVSYVGVPSNFIGSQPAAHGSAYAGILTWSSTVNEREHLGTELVEPLEPGVPVHIVLKAAPATAGSQQNPRYSCDGLGLLFTTEPYFQNNSAPLPDYAAIHILTAPLDTANWTSVSGTYTPDSAYRFAVVGGFYRDELVSPVLVNPDGLIALCYMFIDDICISTDPQTCGLDVLVPSPTKVQPSVSPNPFTSELVIAVEHVDTPIQVLLQDLTGRVLRATWLERGQLSLTIDGSELPSGAYLITCRTSSNHLKSTVVLHVSP